MKKKIKIYQVDAFTNKAFGGNPAGVVFDAEELSDEQMQKIANEMALSETAFISKSYSDGYDYEVRFFTPTEEVDLCGHATIGAFYLMAKLGLINSKEKVVTVKQKTLAGVLPVEIIFNKGTVSKVMMTQAKPKYLFTVEEIDELAKIMDINKEDIGIDKFGGVPMAYSTGLPDIMLPVKNIEVLERIKPNFSLLSKYSKNKKVIGVHAFTLKDINKNIVSCRNFAPAYGINEEAATGTSNGALAAYLIENKIVDFDKNIDLICEQGHFINRPSQIHVKILRNGNEMTIKVGGEAVIIMEGTIFLKEVIK